MIAISNVGGSPGQFEEAERHGWRRIVCRLKSIRGAVAIFAGGESRGRRGGAVGRERLRLLVEPLAHSEDHLVEPGIQKHMN